MADKVVIHAAKGLKGFFRSAVALVSLADTAVAIAIKSVLAPHTDLYCPHHRNRHIVILQRPCLMLGCCPDQPITYHLSR